MQKTATHLLRFTLGISAITIACMASADVKPGASLKATVIATSNNDGPSWLQGGLGRYNAGSEEDDNQELWGDIQLGYKGYLFNHIEYAAHVQLRASSDENSGKDVGFIELKARYIQPLNEQQRLLFTVGQFFLPSSMENTDPFWDSPYTLTYSSLNSWIGEEFRPLGIDIDFRHKFDDGSQWRLAATAFRGNDSMGAILAWRGFSYGRLLSTYDEVHPLPPLASLADDGSFNKQRDDGSKPFGSDLDGKTGYALRTSWLQPKAYEFKLTAVDNKGDQLLYKGEYAWATRFAIFGAKWWINEHWTLLGEYSAGNTAMGPADNADVSFRSAYVLGSYLSGNWRYSLRYDDFISEDNDNTVDDINADKGQSITAAFFWEPAGQHYKIGSEILQLNSERERILVNGLYLDDNSYQLSVMASLAF
ncbi:MAG: hypothetical protein HRU20_03845 [Pseudomonadales bacterium]|nr:hypothetical protein [Pseudomonadales bacterium]